MKLSARTARPATVALLAVAVAVAGLSASARGQPAPNEAVHWNEIASTAIMATAAQPPQAAVLSLAMVQGATYDAVNAIDGGHQPYLFAVPADGGASKEAAAATAAFRVLVGFREDERDPPLAGLFPAQRPALQTLYDLSLGNVSAGPGKEQGISVGAAAAAAMLIARSGDGRFGSFKFPEGSDPG